MTLQQACTHSISQLQLLEKAAQEHLFEKNLLHMQTTHAAVVAIVSKEGASYFEKLQGELIDKSGGKASTSDEALRNRRAMAASLMAQ